jgi:DNA replication licensing factor MCM7
MAGAPSSASEYPNYEVSAARRARSREDCGGARRARQLAGTPSPLPPARTLTRAAAAVRCPPPQKERERCLAFLKEFRLPAPAGEGDGGGKGGASRAKYLELIRDVCVRRRSKAVTITIDLDDIVLHQDAPLADEIVKNSMRYASLFATAIDAIVDENKSGPAADAALVDTEDIHDVLLNHRVQMIKQAQAASADAAPPGAPARDVDMAAVVRASLPAALRRRYEVRFRPRAEDERAALALRQVKAADLGKLVTIKAIVLRASDVKPIIQVAAYTW